MDNYNGIVSLYGSFIGIILIIYHHFRPLKQPYYEYCQKMLIVTEALLMINVLFSFFGSEKYYAVMMIACALCSTVMTCFYCRFIHIVIRRNRQSYSSRKYFLVMALIIIRTGFCLATCITPVFYDIYQQSVTDRNLYVAMMVLSSVIEVLLAASLVNNRRFFPDGDYLTLMVLLTVPAVSGTVYENTNAIILPTLMLVIMLISEMRMSVDAMKKSETSIQYLQTRATIGKLKPHYIINVLTTIYYALDSGDSGRELMLKFIRYLRNSLKNSESNETIELDSEIEAVRDYVSIEEYRFRNISVEYRLSSTDFRVYPFTVQSLVENSIRHGIKDRTGKVTVRSWSDENGDFVQVSDNGCGFDCRIPADPDTPSALRYISDLLKINNAGELLIERQNDLTVVTMKMNRQQ